MSEADKLLESPLQIIDRPESSMEPMEQKENFCLVQENSSVSVQTKRNRNGVGFNLRKSLAWNQAFFTEEGVLDPTELSRLSKSSSKSAGNCLVLNEISPLTSRHKSSVSPTTTSLCKDIKPKKLFQSSNIELEAQMTGRKALSSKGTFKSIPRSPSTKLHKRVSTITANLTSKVPKFTKLPSASRASSNPILPTCSSKIDKSMIKVCAGQNTTVRSPTAKMDFACSSLSANFSAAHGKGLGKTSGADLKECSNVISFHKHDTVTCGPTKQVTKSPSQTINNIPRPSALRMPSPSLGFFCQGKASTSYDNQLHRPLQEAKRIPIMPPKELKQKGQLQPQPTSFSQQSSKAITEEHSSSSNPSSPHTASVHVITNAEMKPVNSTSCYSERGSGSLKPSNDSFIQEQKDILSSILKNVCDAPAKDYDNISRSVKPQIVCDMVETEVHNSGNIADAPIIAFKMNDASCFHESRLGSCLNEAYNDLRVEAGGEIYPNANEHSPRDDYLECSSDVELGIANENGLNVSTETRLSTEAEKKRDDFPNNQQLGCLVLPSSQTYDQVTKNQTFIEKHSSEIEEMKIHDSHSKSTNTSFSSPEEPDTDFDEIQDPHCNSTCMNSSTNSDLLNRRKMMSSDISRQELLLNVEPFSDEWIAALEAFGEEILVKKTGAVQNSPTDKSLPEPGPWSPVKKVQEVGPFDCTKHTKNLASSSTD